MLSAKAWLNEFTSTKKIISVPLFNNIAINLKTLFLLLLSLLRREHSWIIFFQTLSPDKQKNLPQFQGISKRLGATPFIGCASIRLDFLRHGSGSRTWPLAEKAGNQIEKRLREYGQGWETDKKRHKAEGGWQKVKGKRQKAQGARQK